MSSYLACPLPYVSLLAFCAWHEGPIARVTTLCLMPAMVQKCLHVAFVEEAGAGVEVVMQSPSLIKKVVIEEADPWLVSRCAVYAEYVAPWIDISRSGSVVECSDHSHGAPRDGN